MVLFFVSVLLALTVSGICSLLEATLLSLTPAQVAELSERRPRVGAIWQGFKKNIERPIAVILIINTASHTVGATVAGSTFEAAFDPKYLVVFSVVFTFLMLQASEILPKTVGVQQNARVAPLVAFPLAFAVKVLTPVSYFVHLLNRPFERRGAGEPSTVAEIKALASMARSSKLIDRGQEKIIAEASELARDTATDVMIPVDQVAFLKVPATIDEAVGQALADLHTRFPVALEGDVDRLAGYVNFKELVARQRDMGGRAPIDELILPLAFVGPEEPASKLMRTFVDENVHVAIVRDEQSKTLGIVTLEDIVEELVGEIEDEFDRLSRRCLPLHEKGGWLFGGGLPLAEVAAKTGASFPEGVRHLAEWLTARLEGRPRAGASHDHEGWRFTVRRARKGAILSVTARATGAEAKAAE